MEKQGVHAKGFTELVYRNKVIEPPYLIRKYGVTEEEYARLTDEDTKADLFDGMLVIHSPASMRHETIFRFLLFLMYGYAEHRELGEVFGSRATMHLGYFRLFEPDILFVRKERLELVKERQVEGAADMVVEIISEWTRDYDLREKRLAYQEAEVNEIWFIDEEEQKVMVERKEGKRYITETITLGKVVDFLWRLSGSGERPYRILPHVYNRF